VLPAEAPSSYRRREAKEHLDAVAQLWQKARDPGLPLDAIVRAAAGRARLRVGDQVDDPFLRWVDRVRPDLRTRAGEALGTAERLAEPAAHPSAEAARAAGHALLEVEREARRW
jgi:hypothetical protein